MADDCSRLWKLTDSQLLAYFNHTYPQSKPWKLVHLRPEMHSALILGLLKQRQEPQSFLGEPALKTVTGKCGKTSLPISMASTSTSRSSINTSSYIFSKYSQLNYNEDSLHPVVNLSNLAKWKTTYGPSEQRSPTWTTLTLTPPPYDLRPPTQQD